MPPRLSIEAPDPPIEIEPPESFGALVLIDSDAEYPYCAIPKVHPNQGEKSNP